MARPMARVSAWCEAAGESTHLPDTAALFAALEEFIRESD